MLFPGVRYHLTDPFGASRKVHALTREVAIVETLGLHHPAAPYRPMSEFHKDDRVNDDPTTWWAPTEAGLRDMLESVGVRHVQTKSGVSTLPPADLQRPVLLRIIAHAWKCHRSRPSEAGTHAAGDGPSPLAVIRRRNLGKRPQAEP